MVLEGGRDREGKRGETGWRMNYQHQDSVAFSIYEDPRRNKRRIKEISDIDQEDLGYVSLR